jgi:phosphonate transport system permease protein
MTGSATRAATVKALRRNRPRSKRLRAAAAAAGILTAYAWTCGDIAVDDAFSDRRFDNAARFVRELVPFPLRNGEFSWRGLGDWIYGLLAGGGAEAIAATLAIAVAAAVLAGALGALAAPAAARSIMNPEPFVRSPRAASRTARLLASVCVTATRTLLIFLRAIPEYVWAFLWIAMFGFTAWPAVLALALHNTGILGKLDSEVLENADPRAAVLLRRLGAGRAQILSEALIPAVLPRFLLYFFYRWETCVREATVLGMLGVASLGALVRDARASNYYDEMLFYVLSGAALVAAGDLLSDFARRIVRRAA